MQGEVYVAPFPEISSARLVSRDGGSEPRWARNGRELFYKSGGQLVAVAVTPGPTLQFGSPQPLFPVDEYRAASNRPQYDVAPDGQHFVMIKEVGGSVDNLVYVENWFPELLEKMRR